MKKTEKTILVLILFLLTVFAGPGRGLAVDLGLTPSPVYGLWTNINKAVMLYAGERTTDGPWLNSLKAMKAKKFSGKVPADVLELVKRFNARLDQLQVGGAVQTTDKLLEGNLPHLLKGEDVRVTPSMVYLHSGHVLVDLAGDILKTSAAPPEISFLFNEYHFTGKTPSDVFGLVDLALQRLDEILARQESGLLNGKPRP